MTTPANQRLLPGARLPVAGRDAVWLQDSPTNLMVINAVFTTDRIDLATVRALFQRRVLETVDGRFERFTWLVDRDRGAPMWRSDPGFDISRHIFAAPAEPLRDTPGLRRHVGASAAEPLPTDRPLWQIQVVEEFEDNATAFFVRIHHSIGDGMALVSVLFHFMEELEQAPPETVVDRPAGRGSAGAALLRLLRLPLAAPAILLSRTLWQPDRHALHGPRLSGQKRVAWTAPIGLEQIKEVKNRLGATVNDVLMAIVSGALSRYLVRHDNHKAERFRVSMPVNVRHPSAPLTLENRFAAVPLVLPSGLPVGRQRVAAVKQRMDALKRSVEPIVVYGIVKLLLSTMPQGVSRALIDFLANKCTAVVTNVPGPQRGIALAGRRVRSMMFWVPQRADIGVGISILSFAGKVQVGVFCDTALMADPEELVRDFEAEFVEMRTW